MSLTLFIVFKPTTINNRYYLARGSFNKVVLVVVLLIFNFGDLSYGTEKVSRQFIHESQTHLIK